MDIYWVLFKVSLLLAGFSFILKITTLNRKFQRPDLSRYLYFLVFIYIYAALNIIGKAFAQNIFNSLQISFEANTVLGIIFQICSAPFYIAAYFYFIAMLFQERLPGAFKKLKYFYLFISILLLGIVVHSTATFSGEKLQHFIRDSGNPFILLNGFVMLMVLGGLIVSMTDNRHLKGGSEPGMKWFYLLYMILLPFNFAISDLFEYDCHRYSIVEFFIHLIPVYYLVFFLERNPRILETETLSLRLNRLQEEYQISKRELEIVRLIMEGKSNHDIEKALFISLNTVKSHVYNIFKKIAVKNRFELIALVNRYDPDRIHGSP